MNKELGDTSTPPRRKPIIHKKVTNLPMPLDLPNRIHALAANKSKDFIILDNHGNPFITSDLVDDSSVDTSSVEVETVDDDDDSSSDSDDDINDDDSSDNESENSGVSDRSSSNEGVSETNRQESEEQGPF